MARLEEKCKKCFYCVPFDSTVKMCGYILINHHSRGCDIKGCSKFRAKNKKSGGWHAYRDSQTI